ncbi:hypothetical protein MCAG_05398 [Micromonospora sp. ATCC 39149]|nr:fused MFS/spermidine synthase [Micromonospora sp. ATCC 39149]EEP75071.1 hypothetical protein MCAG_05398 [Micromonospora sp. ATCC 39149]
MHSAAEGWNSWSTPSRRTGRTLLAGGVASPTSTSPTPVTLQLRSTSAGWPPWSTSPHRPCTPVDALHLGGGALTLPRYVGATRPGSAQLVVERDAGVVELVRRELPPPPPGVRVEVADARDALTAAPAHGYDLVLTDVYQAARMPGHVASVEFAAEAARVLRPDGILLVNVTDLPPLVFTRARAATLRAVFADVCLLADRRMLRGRRYGNLVLAAARRPGRLPMGRLETRATRDSVPGRALHGPALDEFVGGAAPDTDAALGLT